MLQNWNNMHLGRLLSGLIFTSVCVLATGCSTREINRVNERSLYDGGLAVGFVSNRGDMSAMSAHDRKRHADRLASAILELNPGLGGRVDSYAYVSARVGKPFGDIINSYRLEGSLSTRARKLVRDSKLRRPYLMLATISPGDETHQLPVDVDPVSGPMNPQIDDYEDVRYQTIRLKSIYVEIYDTRSGGKIFAKDYRTDDKDLILATERSGRRYVGNSLLGAVANTISNQIKRVGKLTHPPAPGSDEMLVYLWRRVARDLPGSKVHK